MIKSLPKYSPAEDQKAEPKIIYKSNIYINNHAALFSHWTHISVKTQAMEVLKLEDAIFWILDQKLISFRL